MRLMSPPRPQPSTLNPKPCPTQGLLAHETHPPIVLCGHGHSRHDMPAAALDELLALAQVPGATLGPFSWEEAVDCAPMDVELAAPDHRFK